MGQRLRDREEVRSISDGGHCNSKDWKLDGGPCISDVWESLVANNLHLRKWFETLEMDSGNQDVVPLGPRVVR